MCYECAVLVVHIEDTPFWLYCYTSVVRKRHQ